MAQKFQLTKPAIQDIQHITDYLAETSGLTAAETFLAQLEQKLARLTDFPNLGPARHEILPNLRSLPLNSYLILYLPSRNGIDILRIVSGYRDLSALFEE